MVIRLGLYLFVLSSPFYLLGVINRTKALWAGRKGAPLLQSFHEFRKLMRKGEVVSSSSSFVFQVAPTVNFAAVITAALILPLPGHKAFLSFTGDFIFFSYILALAKFFMVIAALDTGSSFEGMGAAREMTFSTLVEPAFFLMIGSLALLTGRTSFGEMFSSFGGVTGDALLLKILLPALLAVMILTEGARVPVDDPNTHLELTMIHEVMLLDHSGPDLAFMIYSSALKMVLLIVLGINFLFAQVMGGLASLLILAGGVTVAGIGIGLIESWFARLRMSHIPQFILLMSALAMAAFAIVIFYLHGGF
ncbi:MAG: NADH-quinone oxidoreductase subunit H [candidate division KSB1 bacterium]|nr:NADH-quinone oxidoreductase subunit H [candidate division KSB1 bacterium]